MKLLLALALFSATAMADPMPPGWQASGGLEPIGYTDLNGRRGGWGIWVLRDETKGNTR